MTHLSHAYPQGANLYFIFIARIGTIKEYLQLQYGILEAIAKSGLATPPERELAEMLGVTARPCARKPCSVFPTAGLKSGTANTPA